MNLSFDKKLADNYTSQSQKIRVLTEDWVDNQIFCPNCEEDYELKSKKETIGNKLVDGAYHTMIERLQSSNNPNFFLLNYDLQNFEVLNFFVIPKHFFIPDIIEERKALSQTARRAGWIGCNILLQSIPQSGDRK